MAIDDLKEAFAGESQANQKYRAFAAQAEQDGFPNIARLFRTTAEAERIHAEGHLKALDGVGSTADEPAGGHRRRDVRVHRDVPADAASGRRQSGHKATRMFGYAVEAEAVHAKLYALALEAVKEGKDLAEARFYLCPVCGHIEFGEPPESCPICGTKASRFVQI